MRLDKISIINYKNIEQAELSLSPKVNCFLGNNGMGKTNLLDAIYYLSFCKSHTNLSDTQNIKHGSDVALMQAWYDVDGTQEEVFCGLKRRSKKQFKRNKKEYEKLSDHIGFLPLVLVSPSDTELITGGSEERRKFMDVVISQFDKEYLYSLIKYNKALQQRNALLKMDDRQVDESLFDIWEEQMAHEGSLIYQRRKSFIDKFTPTFQRFYDAICRSNETVKFAYESHLNESDFLGQMERRRERDRILGHSTVGIHRDDLEMYMDEHPIKRIGSQGQNKTFVIALKFAQFHFLLEEGKHTPILLLDDIFDKLDSSRVEEIIKIVSGEEFGQIFITDTNRDHLSSILERISKDFHLYEVEQGEVKRL